MFHALFFVSCLLLALFRRALVPFGRGDRDVFSCTGFICFDMPARNGMVERFVSVCRASDAGTERKRTVTECRRRNARSILACVSLSVSVAGPCRLRLAGMRSRGKRNCRSRRNGSPRAVPGGRFHNRGTKEPAMRNLRLPRTCAAGWRGFVAYAFFRLVRQETHRPFGRKQKKTEAGSGPVCERRSFRGYLSGTIPL